MTTIYALTEPGTDVVRYIGKTDLPLGRRVQAHYSAARRGENTHKAKWLRKLFRQGKEPLVLTLCEAQDGAKTEEVLIAAFRASGFRLTNGTDGGEGRKGIRRSEKERAFLSEFHRGRVITWGDKISAAKKGVALSESHKAALSTAHRGKPVPSRQGASMPPTTYAKLQFGKYKKFCVRSNLSYVDIEL